MINRLNPAIEVVPYWEFNEIVCNIEKANLVVFPCGEVSTGRKYLDEKFAFALSLDKAKELISQLQAAVDYHVQETKALEEYENNAKQQS